MQRIYRVGIKARLPSDEVREIAASKPDLSGENLLDESNLHY
jgi:hypothetical protein